MSHKIYALFDFVLNSQKGYTLDAFLNLPKVQQSTILQYRDKVNSLEIKIENMLYIKEKFQGKVIANDDLVLANYADGLHVGQEDVLRYDTDILKSIQLLRKRLGNKILGLSTHNLQEIEIANMLPLDYIGLGAYRKTNTKDVTKILGANINTLALHSKHPVGAIGGVLSTDIIPHIDYLVLGSNLYED